MNRRTFLGSTSALLIPAVAASPASEPDEMDRVREVPYPIWKGTIHVDLPAEVYEAALDRNRGDEKFGLQETLFDHLDWDWRYTVEGQPVEDLPEP